ncbi:hypothetical protein [Haloferax marisrubri]|nr:hypothetical protein [Haloferax marisrubri]
MNGSKEPQNPTDQQCEHCGLFYAAQGIHNHRPGCPLRDWDTMIQPLDGAGEPAGERGSVPDSDPANPAESGDIEVSDTQKAMTDGGNPIHGAPEPITDGGKDTEEVDGCPDCGSDDYVDADAVLRARNPSAKNTAVLTQYDRVCIECGEAYDA